MLFYRTTADRWIGKNDDASGRQSQQSLLKAPPPPSQPPQHHHQASNWCQQEVETPFYIASGKKEKIFVQM